MGKLPSRLVVALGLFFAAGAGRPTQAQPALCDTDFGVKNLRWSRSGSQLRIDWDKVAPPPGQPSDYDVYAQFFPTYCAARDATLHQKIATVGAPPYLLDLPPETLALATVVRAGCPVPRNVIAWDDFSAPLAKPVLHGVGSASGAAFSFTYWDEHAAALFAVRIGPDNKIVNLTAGTWQQLCPAGRRFDLTDFGTAPSPGNLPPGLYKYQLMAVNSGSSISCSSGGCTPGGDSPATSDPVYVVVGTCPAPAAPTHVLATGNPAAGKPVLVSWDPLPLADGTYTVESSTSASFDTIERSLTTRQATALLPTAPAAADRTIYVRVRAAHGCGTAGPPSEPITKMVFGVRASFFASVSSVAFTAAAGSAASAPVTFRNVGNETGHLSLGATDFFDVSPASLEIAPGESGTATLTARTSVPGFFSGRFNAMPSAGPPLQIPVTLSVLPSISDRTGTKLKVSTSSLAFRAPPGTTPAAQSITVTPAPVTGSSAVTLTIPLSVDRSLRSAADGVPPFRTLLTLKAAGASDADVAVVEIVDVEPPATQPGSGRTPTLLPSFVIPTAVSASGLGGSYFTSDGWLQNVGAFPAGVDLYFTPNDADGITDPGVLRASFPLESGEMRRLSNLVATLFGTAGSGQVELRASSTGLPAIALRTTVESVTGGEATSRYGTEIPVAARGEGAALSAGPYVVPGVADDARSRANLILAETSGQSATVRVTVRDAAGVSLGTVSQDVPPYGNEQVNRLVSAVNPGASVRGGSAIVEVTSGSGTVFPVATIIDNASNAFSAVRGRLPREGAPATSANAASSAAALVIPSAARVVGAFDTHFSTRLSIVNGTGAPADLTLTYHYNDVEEGDVRIAEARLTLPAYGALDPEKGDDALASLFGVTDQSFGWIRVTGPGASRVTAASAVSAQVDPADASKGFKTAQVDALYDDASAFLVNGSAEARFPGAEKSVERRSNLILVEVSGAPADVVVRGYGPKGNPLAEKRVRVDANGYLQIADVFGDTGLALGPGPFQNVTVTAQVVDGAGKVIALLSVNDNVSRNPEIFVLDPAGVPR